MITKKGRNQRKKILSVSARLFWKKGYLGTTIDHIAKGANLNKAAIYYYFKDKSSLLFEILTTSMEQLINYALEINNSNAGPEEKLATILAYQIKWQVMNKGLAGIGRTERRNLPSRLRQKYIDMRDEYEGIVRSIIKEGIKKGIFSFPDIKLASLFTFGLVNSIVYWHKSNQSISIDDIASYACSFIIKALKSNEIN